MRLSSMIWKVALVSAIAVAAPNAAWAVGEQNGRIEGTITEAQTGAPVPGATITIRSSALIGGPRTITSDDSGHYELVALPPGTYDVDVSYAGVKPIRRRVVVRLGETTPLDIAWSAELAQAEVTVVVEERHMTRPDSTQTGTVISADTESKIASGRSYQDTALQVAGTADSGEGGGNPEIKGGNWLMNKWLVDGLDVSDPVLSSFGSNLNFDSISAVEVITGGMEAQYNTMGGVINLITNGGSDEWHVDSSLYVNNRVFSATGQYGSQLYNGIRDFSNVKPGPTQSYQANVNVSGPILKHRLWFALSLEYNYSQSSTPAGPPLNVQAPSDTRNTFLGRIKLTWAPNDKNRITLSVWTDPEFIDNLNEGNANYKLAVANDHQNQGGANAVLQWDYFQNQNINWQIQTGFTYGFIDFGPQGILGSIDYQPSDKMFSAANSMYDPNRSEHVNLTDNTVWYNGATAQYDKRYSFQFDPSVSLRGKLAGSHDAKIGIQSRYIRHSVDVKTPGDATYYDNGAGPGEMGLCDPTTGMGGCFIEVTSPSYSQTQWGYGIGAYIQDKWKPWKRLTIEPGIRFDWGMTKNTIGQTISNMFGVGPRLGFTLDLTGDQKTIFAAYYGRANDVLDLIPSSDEADVSPISQELFFNPSTGKFDQLISASGGPNGYKIDPNAKTPHTDEVTVSLRREVFKDSVAGIDYTYKRVSNIWDGIEINQIWDPSGYRVIGFVDPTHPQKIYQVTTPDSNYREYQGLDFTAESRPSEHWDIYAAYTLSWLYGPGVEEFGQVTFGGISSPFYNNRQRPFYDGFLPEDVRHHVRLRVSYNTHGFNLGGTLDYQSGLPLSKQFYQYTDGGYSNFRSPIGTDPGSNPNDPRGFSEFRLPDTFDVDVRISYDFHDLIKQHLILIGDFFNLFNLSTPTGLDNTDIATFGGVTGRMTPFHFQIGLRYLY